MDPEAPQNPLVPEVAVPVQPRSGLRLPADYYSTPPEGRPIFPRWVPIACGSAAIAFLLLVFGAGAVLMRGGGTKIIDWTFSSIRKEVDKAIGSDVPAADRAALEGEMAALRKNLDRGTVKLEAIQPVLTSLQQAISDEKITRDEALRLTRELHELNNRRLAPKRPGGK